MEERTLYHPNIIVIIMFSSICFLKIVLRVVHIKFCSIKLSIQN